MEAFVGFAYGKHLIDTCSGFARVHRNLYRKVTSRSTSSAHFCSKVQVPTAVCLQKQQRGVDLA